MTEENTPYPILEEVAEHMASNEEAQSDITEEVWPYTTLEQAKQQNRTLMEKIIDRAASDSAWKQQLLDDPETALREADFPEIEQLQRRRQEQLEVRGHITPDDNFSIPDPRDYCFLTWYCARWTLVIKKG